MMGGGNLWNYITYVPQHGCQPILLCVRYIEHYGQCSPQTVKLGGGGDYITHVHQHGCQSILLRVSDIDKLTVKKQFLVWREIEED